MYNGVMDIGTLTEIFAQYGVIGLIIIAFFVLVFWVLKTSQTREDKLYKIIDTLSEELPSIRQSLEEIKHKLR